LPRRPVKAGNPPAPAKIAGISFRDTAHQRRQSAAFCRTFP